MSILSEVDPTGSSPSAPVELRVSAELGQLPVVRAVAQRLALLADFNLDDVSDIVLAVDEVCSELIEGALAGSHLTVAFNVAESDFCTTVSARVGEGYSLRRDAFGWHVLEAVADHIDVAESGDDDSAIGRQVTVELRKTSTLAI